MNVSVNTAAPSGSPPGLPAKLAAAVLWLVAKIGRLASWRLTGHPRAAQAIALQNYFHRSAARFARVMAKLEAGVAFRPVASRAGASGAGGSGAARRERVAPRLRLPMDYGWVARLGEDVRMTAALLGYQLNRRDVAPMIAACPQAQRVLRPMCWMLAIDAPCVARVARKRRTRARGNCVVAPPSPHPRSASQPEPANAGEGDEVASPSPTASPSSRTTYAERKAALWYANTEGRPSTWQFLKRGRR